LQAEEIVDLSGFLRQQHHFLAPASITSAGDLSAHHFLPKAALRPGTVFAGNALC
jgi:hypothetical protein